MFPRSFWWCSSTLVRKNRNMSESSSIKDSLSSLSSCSVSTYRLSSMVYFYTIWQECISSLSQPQKTNFCKASFIVRRTRDPFSRSHASSLVWMGRQFWAEKWQGTGLFTSGLWTSVLVWRFLEYLSLLILVLCHCSNSDAILLDGSSRLWGIAVLAAVFNV